MPRSQLLQSAQEVKRHKCRTCAAQVVVPQCARKREARKHRTSRDSKHGRPTVSPDHKEFREDQATQDDKTQNVVLNDEESDASQHRLVNRKVPQMLD